MEAVVHLDTHVVAWLYADERARLRPVRSKLESATLLISPMVTLELTFLHEIGRLRISGHEIVSDLVTRIGLQISTVPMSQVVDHALHLSWTRDPFDRLIVAHAMAESAPLVTKDEMIRKHFPDAVWQ